jgi:hypothetical protein
MSVEGDLGTLIRLLNPYTDGSAGTMHLAPAGAAPPSSPPAVDPTDLAQIRLEVENHAGEWTFKANPQRVQRALRIEYRYPLKDVTGVPNGLFATQHLLIGYVNGGSQDWP